MSYNSFTKENLDEILKELAKEYRKLAGKSVPAEIVLVGGASILTNYGFRNMTTDMDAIIHASSSMQDAIIRVAHQFDLPNNWLNADFKKTGSYSPKLDEVSVYYKTYSNVLTVRTIKDEYLIAMKLRSGRKYKNDLSDIIGILAEHDRNDNPISMEMIDKAIEKIYGGWSEEFPQDSRKFIENVFITGDFEKTYDKIKSEEKQAKEELVAFDEQYKGVIKESNVDAILEALRKKI